MSLPPKLCQSLAQQYAGLVKNIASDLETVLILVRVISTVKYIHVIHSLRASALDVQSTLSPAQVANVETRLNAQVAQMQEAWTTTSSQLIATVKQEVSSQVANEVANVQTVISEQIARVSSPLVAHDDTLSEQVTALVHLLNDQARTIQNLTASLSEVRREVRTTVTEIRSISHDSATIPQLTGPTVDAATEPGARVRAFLSAWNGSKSPTLQLIMDTCQVAKRTATKYRDEYYGLATGSQSEEEE